MILRFKRPFLLKFSIMIAVLAMLIAGITWKFFHPTILRVSEKQAIQSKQIKKVFLDVHKELKGYPTVLQLAAFIHDPNITASSRGLQVIIHGTSYLAPTYTDSACSKKTKSPGNTVRCVGAVT